MPLISHSPPATRAPETPAANARAAARRWPPAACARPVPFHALFLALFLAPIVALGPLLGLLCLLCLGAAAAQAQPVTHEEPHQLHGQRLCVDADSAMVVLAEVPAARAETARPAIARSIAEALADALDAAGVAVDRPAACAEGPGYVAVFARVALLDETVYRAYGKGAFAYVLSVQVGERADAGWLADHNTLAGLQFMAFEEQVASGDAGGSSFEQRVADRSRLLIDQLARAWREDNP